MRLINNLMEPPQRRLSCMQLCQLSEDYSSQAKHGLGLHNRRGGCRTKAMVNLVCGDIITV